MRKETPQDLELKELLKPIGRYAIIWLTALIAFIGWVCNAPLITFALLAVEAGLLLALFKDMMHVLSPAWFFVFARSKVTLSGQWLWLISLAAIVIGLIVHFIRFRPKVFAPKNILKGFTLSLIVAGVTFAMGGVGVSGRVGWVVAVLVVLGLVLPLCYLVLSAAIQENAGETLLKYVAMLVYTLAILILLQVIVYYARLGSLDVVKVHVKHKWMELGWGVANSVAPTVSIAIPVALYYSLKKSNFAWLHVLFAALLYAMAFVCTCRGVIIIDTIAIILMLIYVFIKTENRAQTGLTVGLVVVAGIVLIVVFREKLYAVFEEVISRGLGDNGRFSLWKLAMERFVKRPIFGVGFDYDMGGFVEDGNSTVPFYYHSTPVQILCCLGVVGFIAHGFLYFHRYRTFLVSRKNALVLALMMGLIIYDAYSWLDRNFFLVPSFIIMTIITLAAENAAPEDKLTPLTVHLVRFVKSKRAVTSAALEPQESTTPQEPTSGEEQQAQNQENI